MPKIRHIDMKLIDELFRMEGGYVLDFSNKTFTEFFADELNVDIDDDRYSADGTSKGRRMRYFLKNSDTHTTIRTLQALWEYRKLFDTRLGRAESVHDAEGRFLSLLHRLKENESSHSQVQPPMPAFDYEKIARLAGRLIELGRFAPQPRGYAFEEWLKDLFNAYGLQARSPFRNRGEQIDGSFILGNETYLLEAKWQDQKASVAELHTFNGKVNDKATWTRGLFVSNSGFTDDGLAAFGRGKSIILMDGWDLYEMLNHKIPLTNVLEQKVRRASETGVPFVRVRDLFHV